MQKSLIAMVITFIFFSCDESTLIDESGTLTISNISLPSLNSGNSNTYEYEAWLLLNGTFVSLQTFNISDVDSNGELQVENVNIEDLNNADACAITVEIASDSNSSSNYVLMVGDFEGNTASLSNNNVTGNGVSTIDYNQSAAYTIQTPTTISITDDENGLWFFTNNGTENVSTLDLNFSEERSDVNYQAWLMKDGLPFNMGIMNGANSVDDSSLFIISTDDLPEFPGEDFVGDPSSITFPDNTFPVNVNDGTLIITAIPTNYNSDTVPFPISIFSGIVSTTTTGAENPFNLNNVDSYSATITR